MPQTYECLFCGIRYERSDSLAANTPELMASMYCSKECHDKDSEYIEAAIAEASKQQSAADIPNEEYQYIEAAGFRLKVPIKKEN